MYALLPFGGMPVFYVLCYNFIQCVFFLCEYFLELEISILDIVGLKGKKYSLHLVS